MQGYIRRLVNPPVSSREAFAELDAKAAESTSEVPAFVIEEHPELIRDKGALTITPYDSITVGRHVVAVHCKGHSPQGYELRFVLWLDTDGAESLVKALTKVTRYVAGVNNE